MCHPRWKVRKPGEIFFDALGGVAVASTLGSDAERSCATTECASNRAGLGFLAGARAGYELWLPPEQPECPDSAAFFSMASMSLVWMHSEMGWASIPL